MEVCARRCLYSVHYAHSEEGAASSVKKVHQKGGKSAVFKADFNDIDSVKNLAKKSIEFLRGLDVLVNTMLELP